MRRLNAAAAGLLVAAMIPMLGVMSPAVAAGGACTSSIGVTVVVSFGSLGGGTVVGCAQTSGSGVAALRAAGFTTEGTQKDGPSFICRINGKPGLEAEKCGATPAGATSWRYFHASNGGSWVFSQSGAGNRNVIQGGFEGWSFGAGSTPSYSPLRADGSNTGTSNGTASGAEGQSAVPGPSSAKDEALPKPKPRTGTSTASTTPTASSIPSTDGTSNDAGVDASPNSGTNWVPWLALVVVLGLISAAIVTHRRRVR